MMRGRVPGAGRVVAAAVAVVVTVGLIGIDAESGGWFGAFLRVEFDADTRGGRPTVVGFVYNDNGVWAGNVRLLVESLDGDGRVIARGYAYVGGGVPPKSRTFFDARSPTTPGASYRVTVESFDWRSP